MTDGICPRNLLGHNQALFSLSYGHTVYMVRQMGFEPTRTYVHKHLKLARIPFPPPAHTWWARQDSNLQCQRRRIYSPLSIQLLNTPEKVGATDGSRPRDLRLDRATFFQLNYGGMVSLEGLEPPIS